MGKTEKPIPETSGDRADLQNLPSYLMNSTTDYWEAITFQFEDMVDFANMRIFTQDEAVDRRNSIELRWDVIPYVDDLDQAELERQLEIMRTLLPSIKKAIRARALSVKFVHEWGLFSGACGILRLIYSSPSKVGHQRSARKGGEARAVKAKAQKRWYAHIFFQFYTVRGTRALAEDKVLRLFGKILQEEQNIYGVSHDWIRSFVEFDEVRKVVTSLKSMLNERHLSIRKMGELMREGRDGIPTTNLNFPEPKEIGKRR